MLGLSSDHSYPVLGVVGMVRFYLSLHRQHHRTAAISKAAAICRGMDSGKSVSNVPPFQRDNHLLTCTVAHRSHHQSNMLKQSEEYTYDPLGHGDHGRYLVNPFIGTDSLGSDPSRNQLRFSAAR